MRKSLQVFALLLTLATFSYAGDMQCPVQQPVTCSVPQGQPVTTGDEIEPGLTEVVLAVLTGVLPLV